MRLTPPTYFALRCLDKFFRIKTGLSYPPDDKDTGVSRISSAEHALRNKGPGCKCTKSYRYI